MKLQGSYTFFSIKKFMGYRGICRGTATDVENCFLKLILLIMLFDVLKFCDCYFVGDINLLFVFSYNELLLLLK